MPKCRAQIADRNHRSSPYQYAFQRLHGVRKRVNLAWHHQFLDLAGVQRIALLSQRKGQESGCVIHAHSLSPEQWPSNTRFVQRTTSFSSSNKPRYHWRSAPRKNPGSGTTLGRLVMRSTSLTPSESRPVSAPRSAQVFRLPTQHAKRNRSAPDPLVFDQGTIVTIANLLDLAGCHGKSHSARGKQNYRSGRGRHRFRRTRDKQGTPLVFLSPQPSASRSSLKALPDCHHHTPAARAVPGYASRRVMAAAICSSGRTWPTAPVLMASAGIPKITEVASSCAITSPPFS